MSLRQELETCRRQIVTVRARDAEETRRQFPPVTELPKGLFNNRQLERWQNAQTLINKAVFDFFEILGGTKFVLEPDFGFAVRSPGSKHVDFRLKFREDESEAEWTDETPYQEVRFHYDTGGRLSSEHIDAYQVGLVIPKKETYRGWFDVEEAIKWMNDPASNSFRVASAGSLTITTESIQNLLKLLLANLKEVQPTTGNLVPR